MTRVLRRSFVELGAVALSADSSVDSVAGALACSVGDTADGGNGDAADGGSATCETGVAVAAVGAEGSEAGAGGCGVGAIASSSLLELRAATGGFRDGLEDDTVVLDCFSLSISALSPLAPALSLPVCINCASTPPRPPPLPLPLPLPLWYGIPALLPRPLEPRPFTLSLNEAVAGWMEVVGGWWWRFSLTEPECSIAEPAPGSPPPAGELADARWANVASSRERVRITSSRIPS